MCSNSNNPNNSEARHAVSLNGHNSSEYCRPRPRGMTGGTVGGEIGAALSWGESGPDLITFTPGIEIDLHQ